MAVSRKGGPQQRTMSDQERDLGQGIADLGGAGNLIQGVVKLLGWELQFPSVSVAKGLPIENASLVKAWMRIYAAVHNLQMEEVNAAIDYGSRKTLQMLSAGELNLDLDSFKTVLETVDIMNAAFMGDHIAETYISLKDFSHDNVAKVHCAIYGVFVSFLFSKNQEGFYTLGRKAQSNGDFNKGFEILFCASVEAIINELTNQEINMTTTATTNTATATTLAQAAPAPRAAPATRVTQATQQAAEDALQQAAFDAAVADAVAKAIAAHLAAAQAAAPAPQAVPPVAAPQAPAAPLAAPVAPAPVAPTPVAPAPTPVAPQATPAITMEDILRRSKEAQAAHEQLRSEVAALDAATTARLSAVEKAQSGFEARLAALEAAKKAATTETTKVVVSSSGSNSSSDCWVDPTLDKAAMAAGYAVGAAAVGYAAMRLFQSLSGNE